MQMSTPPNQSGMNGGRFTVQNSAPNLAANSLDQAAGEKVDMLVSAGDGAIGRLLRKPSPPGKFLPFLLLIPAAIAFGISCYLAYASITATDIAGCSSGQLFDCSHVLHSKYAKWMNIPVSLLAAVNYFGMLLALATICCIAKDSVIKQISWVLVAFTGIAAGMAAIWFVGLQALVLEHYCPWCLGAHACGLIIAASILIRRPVSGRWMLAGIGMAAMGTTGLILGQVLAEEPVKYKIIEHEVAPGTRTNSEGLFSAPGSDDNLFSPPKEEDGNIFEAPRDASVERESSGSLSASLISLFSPTAMVTWNSPDQEESKQEETATGEKQERRTISIQGNLKLDPRQWPLLGSPEAKHIFVEMFDYACPHCRATHRAIKGACESMGDDLAVMVLPVPLNSACNSAITVTGASFVESCEVSKLAVATWRLDPEKFEEFHHWMFEGATAPSYARAKAKADELVGREKLDAELRKEAPGKYVTKHVQLYQHAGRGVVPKLLFPTTTIEGEFTSTSSLVQLIKERAK